MSFKNKTDLDAQFKTYKNGKSTMKTLTDVGPYYITWLLLTYFRIERDNSFNILAGLIIAVTIFEIQVRFNYGSSNFEFFIHLMYSWFPASLTVG